VNGSFAVDGEPHSSAQMLVLRDGIDVELVATEPAKLMLLGGAPLAGERYIWWNFVASDEARIEAAKQRWREQRFPRVPGDDELMPLPD
jgi:redox-sensitive bicupin YhaK (pirin superfamily)